MTSLADPPLRTELRAGLLVGLGCTVAGVVVGAVWRLVVPLAVLEKDAAGVRLVGAAETEVAADGWFAVCTGLAGVLAAVAAVMLLRSGRLGALVGLAAGGLLGALVAWRVGLVLSPPQIAASAKAAHVADTFEAPLRLSAVGVLMAWPTAAVITFFAIVAGLDVDAPAIEPSAVDATTPSEPVTPSVGLSPSGPLEPPSPR